VLFHTASYVGGWAEGEELVACTNLKTQVLMKLLFVCLLVILPVAVYCGTVQCAQYASETIGEYTLFNDLWGESGATGSQCSQVTSTSGTTIVWTTNWTWEGGSGVKSFANVQLNSGINKELSAISSMPTTWTWSYSLSGTAVVDVAWDLWTAASVGGTHEYEIMIWLAAYSAGPLSATYGSNGKPTPVSSFTYDSVKYNLYKDNIGWTVLSFVPTSNVQSFSGDLKPFFTFLITNDYIASTQYLVTHQAGTEPTSGTGKLTSTYSAVVN